MNTISIVLLIILIIIIALVIIGKTQKKNVILIESAKNFLEKTNDILPPTPRPSPGILTDDSIRNPVRQETELQFSHGEKLESRFPVRQETESVIKPHILYNFSNPNCGYSRAFNVTWNNMKQKLKDNKNIKMEEIDSTKKENAELTYYYNISSTPTIILVTPDRVIEYSGNRTIEDLLNFINNHIQ